MSGIVHKQIYFLVSPSDTFRFAEIFGSHDEMPVLLDTLLMLEMHDRLACQ